MTKIVHLRIRIRGDWTRVEQATRISRWIISGHGIYWIVFDANGKGNNHRRAAKRMPAAVNKLPGRRVIPHFQTRSNRWCVSGASQFLSNTAALARWWGSLDYYLSAFSSDGFSRFLVWIVKQ